ncbi:MAG: lytic transglycosylase domain-containing protein [Rectinemataceae bacterium]
MIQRRTLWLLVAFLLISSGEREVELAAQEIIPQPDEISTSIPVEIPVENPESFPVTFLLDLPQAAEGLGAEAWYYEAKKLGQSNETDPAVSESIDFMYTLAFHFGEKTAAKEAGRALVQRATEGGDHAAVEEFVALWLDYFGADWDIYRTLMTDRFAAGNFEGSLKAIGAMRSALPSTAKSKANELAFHEFSSRASLGDFSWWESALPYLRQASPDSWGGKILRLAALAPDMDETTRHLCLMRADYRDKEFAKAWLHASGASEVLHAPGVARFLLSEAGKSFINAGARDEGTAFFMDFFPTTMNAAVEAPVSDLPELIISALGEGKPEERLWVAAYYLARLWLSAERGREAAILFLSLSDNAPSEADADGALWYWLDITMRRLAADDIASFEAGLEAGAGARRSLELGALLEASVHWKDAAYFDDIIESYDRLLLKEKSWDDVLSLLLLIGERVSPGMKTRLMYQSGRLIEENLALVRERTEEERAAITGEYFRAILENKDAEEYYRTMSAWRLGLSPPYLENMPDLSTSAGDGEPEGTEGAVASALSAANGASTANGGGIQSALVLIRNYLNYDLDEMASALAMNYLGSIDKSVIAGLAFALSTEGQHNAALRLARDAVYRGAGSLHPELYGLVYPKAWNDIVASGAAIPGIPEALAYGIIRSESAFDPKAVSYAGAVGLAQLMPATAAETAKGLKMTGYSLTNPADNVRIGMTYYSYMLNRFGGKPMRAMFAYNAGPSRMMAWTMESGELADDILLETLHLAQPMQYAKNIIQASLAYGKIHYGIDPRALLDYLVEATPLPTIAPATLVPATPAPPAVDEPAESEPAEQQTLLRPESLAL